VKPGENRLSHQFPLLSLSVLMGLALVLGVSAWQANAGVASSSNVLSVSLQVPAQSGPGLDLQGHVWLNHENGPGLENVAIYRSYAHYPWGTLVATTDQNGYYKADFAYIPGDEAVHVWPELAGYTFDPEKYSWHHYAGSESKTVNFIAIPPHVFLPLVLRSDRAVFSVMLPSTPSKESK
jgi:hypothetical protein